MAIAGFNHFVGVGQVSAGPWHNGAVEGKAESCAFSLQVPEPTRDGRLFSTYIRCEAFGKSAADALELRPGDTILCEGKLSWQKTGEGKGDGRMIVAVWRIVKLDSTSGSDAP